MITCLSDAHWAALCAVSGHPQWRDDDRYATLPARLRHQDQLDDDIAAWTSGQDGRQLMRRLQDADIPAGGVQNGVDRVANDPQMQHRGWIAVRNHPVLGEHITDGLQIHLSRTPSHRDRPGPLLGEANDYVLTDLLGMSNAEIAELQASGAMG